MRAIAPLAGVVGCLFAPGVAVAAAPASAVATVAREPEPAIEPAGVEGDYLRTLHVRIHFRWVNKYLDELARTRPASDPLNNPALWAEVLFTIRWDGSTAEVTVSQKSGVPAFDQAAVAAVRGELPYPVPPLELIGDDGVAHFGWVFARDHRQCSGAEVRRREAPLDEALPRLFVQGRTKEALLRVARYMRAGDTNAMSAFARTYLARPFADPQAEIAAAAALAKGGDKRRLDKLRAAAVRPETMTVAVPALVALKVDVCPLAAPMLMGTDQRAMAFGARMLRAAGVEQPADSPCAQSLATAVKDPALPAALRADLLGTLAAINPGGVRHLAIDALADPHPSLRAAGARAFARPGGGRPTLYRLEPLLKDASVEVRSGAAAGLIRACGELSFDYLLPLFKDKEAAPLLAMVPELGRQSSPNGLALISKMLKRNDPEIRLAVLSALAGRNDVPARAIYQPLADAVKKNPHATRDERLTVYAGADADELLPLLRDPWFGGMAFKALLRARRHQEAADWLVASFDRLTPEALVDAFAAWLETPPGSVAAASSR